MKVEIKTERLTLRPMSDGAIEALMERTDSDELRSAYGEMLDGCRRDPENRIWYAPWEMVRNDGGESIGDVDFKGPARNHAVEIGYGVQPEYEGRGYTTEAVQAMTRWAFSQKDVVFVEAETDPGNKASQRILEKCGFVPDGTMGEEGPRFVLESPMTNQTPIYIYAVRHRHRYVHRADARPDALGDGARHRPWRACRCAAGRLREEEP